MERLLDNQNPLSIWGKVFWNVLLKNKMSGRRMKGGCLELHKLYEIIEKWEQDWVDRTTALTTPNIWIVAVKTQLLRGHTFLSKLWFLDAIASLAVGHYCQSWSTSYWSYGVISVIAVIVVITMITITVITVTTVIKVIYHK